LQKVKSNGANCLSTVNRTKFVHIIKCVVFILSNWIKPQKRWTWYRRQNREDHLWTLKLGTILGDPMQ